MHSPVVRDSLLSLSNTAYNKSKYSKLVVIFIKIPLVFTNVVFLLQYATAFFNVHNISLFFK